MNEPSVAPNAYNVVRDFERALCDYTGAKYAVAVNSCTAALQVCLMYQRYVRERYQVSYMLPEVIIPKHTYVGVPMVAKLTGHAVKFVDARWKGQYRLQPYPIWDSARSLYKGMVPHSGEYFYCLSFHWTKVLKLGWGGAILHNSQEADHYLRRMAFDGRTPGLSPQYDTFPVLGIHANIPPSLAAEGIVRLGLLPDFNEPLPNSDYPDLSLHPVFR